jgi:AcrR family transcriptional regulator
MVDPDVGKFTAKGFAARERILVAATNVLLAEGLSGFSVDKVREAAAVSGSQIAHYFTDRDELVRAVVQRQVLELLAFHRQPKLGGLDTFEDWQSWADLNVRHLRRAGYRGTATYHTLAGQLAKSDDDTRQVLAAGYWRWASLLEDCFARMKARGTLVAAADPRRLALVVMSCHQGAGMLAFTYRQDWPLVDVAGFVVDYLRSHAADPAERPSARSRRVRRRRLATVLAAGAHAQDGPARFTRKGLATRARIVEGAMGLMYERGVSGTRLDDVRLALGVSGSQLSHYFADKQDLTRQVVRARTDSVVAFHRHPKLANLDRLQDFRTWADLCWTLGVPDYLRLGCVYGALTGELLEADDEVRDVLAAGYDRWLGVFEEGLTTMRRRGDLVPEADPAHLAIALLGAHQGGALLTHVTGTGEPFRAAVDAVIDYIGSFAPPKNGRTSRSPRSQRVS